MFKKTFSIILVCFAFLLFSCSSNNEIQDQNTNEDIIKVEKFELAVVDNWNLLKYPLEKEYEVGSLVEVYLLNKPGQTVGIKINDEIYDSTDLTNSSDYKKVTFTMPDEDTILYTHLNGYIVNVCNNNKHQYRIAKNDTASVLQDSIIFSCINCGHEKEIEQSDINTNANFTFFPENRSSFHNIELKKAYEAYMEIRNWDLSRYGTYEIFNYISEDIYNKYNMDLFEVYYEEISYYFIKHYDDLYMLSLSYLNHDNYNCINHVGVTDMNNDGYIEIFTAINSFKDRVNYYYCSSYVKVIDTKLKSDIEIIDSNNINYFKENENGIISIYDTNGIVPQSEDLHDGILDKKYYDLATNLYDVPIINNANYVFKEKNVKASCDLFEVEIDIEDASIEFPYIFSSSYLRPYFIINAKIKTKYLGEVTVSFVNEDFTIESEGVFVPLGITESGNLNNFVIEKKYKYNEDLNIVNENGIYDLVITYEVKKLNIKESIIIEDFLDLSWK